MVVVEPLFAGGDFRTTVWISPSVKNGFAELSKKDRTTAGRFLKKLEYYARTGFGSFEGDRGAPIRHEWDGIYRVALHNSLFRLVGFYEGQDKSLFVVLDSFKKRGQELSSSERERINAVGVVKRNRDWRKRVKA